MALVGDAFLAMWHDIEPASWNDYMEWHTREHMPERLSIPGFTVGKRLINHDLDRYRYGTIYAGQNLEVFRSPAYLERLNNPTPWSQALQPAFRNFLRVACERIASSGLGEGGAVATVRLEFAPSGNEATVRAGAQRLADQLLKVVGVCCVHVGLARTEVSSVKTRETELRPAMAEKGFDAIVLVEGSGRPELEAVLGQIEAAILESDCGLANPSSLVYNLAYQISAADMQNTGTA